MVTELRGHKENVTCLHVSSLYGDPILATGSKDKTIKIWNLTVRSTSSPVHLWLPHLSEASNSRLETSPAPITLLTLSHAPSTEKNVCIYPHGTFKVHYEGPHTRESPTFGIQRRHSQSLGSQQRLVHTQRQNGRSPRQYRYLRRNARFRIGTNVHGTSLVRFAC